MDDFIFRIIYKNMPVQMHYEISILIVLPLNYRFFSLFKNGKLRYKIDIIADAKTKGIKNRIMFS